MLFCVIFNFFRTHSLGPIREVRGETLPSSSVQDHYYPRSVNFLTLAGCSLSLFRYGYSLIGMRDTSATW